MAQEELFFRRQKRVRRADDGAQRGGHLHGHKQKDDYPRVEARVRPGV
jgi:hypothetical protein